jgi:hypothetical protein
MATVANPRHEVFCNEFAKDTTPLLGGFAIIEAVRGSGGSSG